MVNIRADDDQEPEDVLAQFSLEQRVGAGAALCGGVCALRKSSSRREACWHSCRQQEAAGVRGQL